MPDRFTNTIYLLYALAAISGGLGGCAIASHKLVTGKKMRLSFFLAYVLMGVAFGILFASYGWIVADTSHPLDIVGPAMVAGAIGSGTLGGLNWTARIILKHLGVEIQVTMRKHHEDRRENDNEKNSID